MADCTCECGHTGGAYQRPCSVPGGCRTEGCDGYGRIRAAAGGIAEEPPTCALCGRRHPDPPRVDQRCRERVLGWLADLPSLEQRLEAEEIPAPMIGERVRSSSPHSRPAASLPALSLRTASAQRLAAARLQGPADWTPEGADLPIPAWADGWARAWRRRHEHHRPDLQDWVTELGPEAVRDDGRPTPPRPPARDATDDEKTAFVTAVHEYRKRVADWLTSSEAQAARESRELQAALGGRIVLGLGPAQHPLARADDPLAERMAYRYGTTPARYKLGLDCGYLAAWFERACDDEGRHPDIAAFVTGLRDLVASAETILSGRATDGTVWCGWCPTPRYDRDLDLTVPCGTRLWMDPYVSVLDCPRCRSHWDRAGGGFLRLRGAQLGIWSEDELRDPRSVPAPRAMPENNPEPTT